MDKKVNIWGKSGRGVEWKTRSGVQFDARNRDDHIVDSEFYRKAAEGCKYWDNTGGRVCNSTINMSPLYRSICLICCVLLPSSYPPSGIIKDSSHLLNPIYPPVQSSWCCPGFVLIQLICKCLLWTTPEDKINWLKGRLEQLLLPINPMQTDNWDTHTHTH